MVKKFWSGKWSGRPRRYLYKGTRMSGCEWWWWWVRMKDRWGAGGRVYMWFEVVNWKAGEGFAGGGRGSMTVEGWWRVSHIGMELGTGLGVRRGELGYGVQWHIWRVEGNGSGFGVNTASCWVVSWWFWGSGNELSFLVEEGWERHA